MNTNTTTRTEGQQPGPCITGSQALLESFLREGVDTLFGYPGGAIIPVYDALFDYRDRLRHILVRHEQGAVHAAQGYARVSGRVGVCLVTSGPGATNTVTGLADALMDSTPLVLVTGQVGSSLLGTDAFQETNFVGITQAVTKWNCQVKRTEDIPGAIAKAFYIARSGRPGPVVVDITKDAQCGTAPFRYERLTSIRSYVPAPAPAEECIAEAVRLIDAAQRPLLMAGQGVMLGNAEEELQAFLAKSGIPVASTLLGLSAVPTSSPQYVGMLGMHGNYGPNIRNQECDLLIAVGMRFDDRVTGNPKCFGANAKVIHLEIDPAEIDKIVHADVAVIGDVKQTLPLLTQRIRPAAHKAWIEGFRACDKVEYEAVVRKAIRPEGGCIRMGEVVDTVAHAYDNDAVLVTDVGQQQMFAARYFGFRRSRSLVTSGGLGTMGFGLPAAIGAKLGAPDREVCLFAGDGGLQMTIQELGTIFQSQVAVKIVLLNNSYLGMVRQWQGTLLRPPLLVHRTGEPRLRADRPRQRHRLPLRGAARRAGRGGGRDESLQRRLPVGGARRKRRKRIPDGAGRRSRVGDPARINRTRYGTRVYHHRIFGEQGRAAEPDHDGLHVPQCQHRKPDDFRVGARGHP